VYLLGVQEGRDEIQPVAASLADFLHWPRHTAHGSGDGSQSI
jgi:hypothetical protein